MLFIHAVQITSLFSAISQTSLFVFNYIFYSWMCATSLEFLFYVVFCPSLPCFSSTAASSPHRHSIPSSICSPSQFLICLNAMNLSFINTVKHMKRSLHTQNNHTTVALFTTFQNYIVLPSGFFNAVSVLGSTSTK